MRVVCYVSLAGSDEKINSDKRANITRERELKCSICANSANSAKKKAKKKKRGRNKTMCHLGMLFSKFYQSL